MVYIFNTHLKNNISVITALTKLIGIGRVLAIQTCDQLGISKILRLRDLSAYQIDQLSQIIHQKYYIGSELRTLIKKNKTRLSQISTYRGFRLLEGLPCRGQRTHGNARTSRKYKLNVIKH